MSEDINVTDGTVLEALNNKVDLDGGNYKGSPLEEYIHEHCGGGMPIGLVYPLDCSQDYIPNGSLPTDGAEYTESQFKELWKDYLTSDELEPYEEPWTEPFDIGFKLNDCIYANDLYVAVGELGEIATSTNGVAWNIVYQRDDEYALNSITYGNGLFVAVGEINKVVTSNDGVNWTEQIIEIDDSTIFRDIIYANGLFVAVGQSNALMTSNDGINWTASTIATASSSSNFKSIVYGNGLFAIVSLNNNILISTDCVNWTVTEQSNVILKFNDIIYANGLFVAVDNNGNILTSTDCINWTIRFTHEYYFTTLAYGNGLFVACGGAYSQIATSTDGINWENTEHVFAGSKISYCKDKFIYAATSNAIIKICSNKPKALLNTCFYSEYQLDIIKYGQCGKFAVDVENNTFRVPLIKDGAVIQQALTNDELGKAYNAGAPDITGDFDVNGSLTPHGAFYDEEAYKGHALVANTPVDSRTGFSASLSNPIYGNSDTVQMNAVAMRYFVVVANGSTNESLMDWSEWASSLQGKANVDFSNISNDAKVVINEFSSLDIANAIHVSSSPATNSTYTAPQDGWFYAFGVSGSDSRSLLRLSIGEDVFTTPIIDHNMIEDKGQLVAVNIPVCKGDTVLYVSINVTLTYGTYTNLGIWFVPKKGAQ